jgi:predicted TIM-barrel fold metal-dependent hydrolase
MVENVSPTKEIYLHEYRPKSRLSTKKTPVARPRFPVVDAHNHLGDSFGGGWDKRPVAELLDVLDEAGVEVYVDLDGGWGEEILRQHLDHFKAAAPERFLLFGGVDWAAWAGQGDNFGEWAARKLRAQASAGAQGLKIWKKFGLQVRDHLGQLVSVNDQRLDPLWQTAGDLHLPVMIHVADPVAFFDPLDIHNERWEELHGHPDWHFPSPPYPAFQSIMDDLANLVSRHPNTTFIGAHVGCYSENLAWVSRLLEQCSNFYVDISARISELGRQPYTARQFMMEHADQVLFGTDMGPDIDTYGIYYRFLETDDEYFNYGTTEVPGQGRWFIYGLYLPDDVLEKVYHSNARRIFRLNG